jgi:hypothetical protein
VFTLDRRAFLAASAATCAMVGLRPTPALAATHTRKSLEGPNVGADLEGYKNAVRAMLALPPEDPRNWYRNAMTHLLDCPHGNWWFLVWHRGYLGWFERICREVTDNPAFALPYWDWTREPRIPASFWGNVLQPGTEGYIADAATFDRTFRGPAQAYWNTFTPAQLAQQRLRGYPSFDVFWNAALNAFFPSDATRELTEQNPDLNDRTKVAVSKHTIDTLLAPTEFEAPDGTPGFESARATNHHVNTRDYSILEGQPHNNVHDSIGGFMGLFLSPTDPIFFMHHSNIDRLWDVWTRKQQARNLPIGPDADQWPDYSSQPFLFFHDAEGNPVTETAAGDYFSIGDFDYDYEPGTGEDVVGVPVASALPSAGTMNLSTAFGVDTGAASTVALPPALAAGLREGDGRPAFARVTVDSADLAFDVFVAAQGATIDPSLDGPNFAGSFVFFGHDHDPDAPLTFSVALGDVVDRLREAGALDDGAALQVTVVASGDTGPATLTAPLAAGARQGILQSVTIGAF